MDDDSTEPADELLAAVAHIPPRQPRRPEWTPPVELDEYRLIRPLGRGGMGSVWLAEDRLLERLVAVKFIQGEPDAQMRARFAIEARAAARLSHVNVVTVHRYGELAGHPYLVSEYIRGESLDQLAKPVPWERSLELGVALARGLAAAHRHGIVHRDIKPANAILTADGDAKLVDFGLAKLDHHDAGGPAVGLDLRSLTDRGRIAGTPRYLAPEVRRGEPASRRSDVYQLGAILYELVTGRAPIVDLIARQGATVDNDAPAPPPRGELVVPALVDRLGPAGARFATVVDRCLRNDPADRFAGGDELREALEQIQPSVELGELPAGNPYRGLVPFEAEHRALFFGRAAEIRAVVERLRSDAFVVVTGDSGAGKSSLCRAGVLPRVADGALDGEPWSVVQLVPGQRPATTLISVLCDELGIDEATLEAVRDEPRAFVRELRRAREGGGIVVFVDQLEELATIAEPDEARVAAALLGELAAGSPKLRLLATVRGDFLTRVAELPALGPEIGGAIQLLGPLTADGARQAVVGPATATGVRFESEALVDALVDTTTELPLLAFTLARLWEARDPATNTISAASLDAIGGVRGALARHADGVLDRLLPDQRATAKRLLLRLVTAERTRVRRTRAELADFDPAVLDALVRGRLVVARGDAYELAHERLIDGWPTLATWIDDAGEAIAVHARLAVAVAEWERLGRTRDGLWSGRRLADVAIVPADGLAAAEREFVRASRRAARRRRWLRSGAVASVPLAVISLYIGARVVTRHDLDGRIADNVAEAEPLLVRARVATDTANRLRSAALGVFDHGDLERGETAWDDYRRRSDDAQAAYARAARALEAALLLDGDRADVRADLARVTLERMELAGREHRDGERAELESRLGLYDPELAARLVAPARLETAITSAGSSVVVLDAGGTPAAGERLTPGSYVVEARAPGRATVRVPVLLRNGETRRVELELPPPVPEGFAYIPSGAFLYGSREGDSARRFFGTAPLHEVRVAAFLIGFTEVTYAQWMEFLDNLDPVARDQHTPHVGMSSNVEGGGVELRRLPDGTRELHISPTAGVTYVARAGELLAYRDRRERARQDWRQFPVTGISVEDALAYTAWLDRTGRVAHARLCTEHEWEYASRGVDGRPFPNGDQLADANIDATYGHKDGGFGPDAVGAHPASVSPFGLLDTSGNVWELVRDVARNGFVTRGGCYYTSPRSAHLANRNWIPPNVRHVQIGLRVCASVE